MAGTNPRRAAPARTRRSTRGSSSTPSTNRATSTTTNGRKRRFLDYPRSGYHGLHRWLPSWRFALGSVLAVGFLGFGAVVAAYAAVKVPAADADIRSQTTTVYFADNPDGTPGNVMGTFQVQKRQIVDYATLPEYVGRSVAASEDRTFFENKGVDLKGMARAFWHNLRREPGQRAQGGSTLTQQYVERYYVDKTTTDYVGKAKEALLALKVTQQQSKEEILGGYLNTIYWGRDSYGIQAAAQSYFGVDAKDLTVSQAAMLAGIIPSPNNWDPAVSPKKAQARWNMVLDSMQELGWIDPGERASAVFPTTITYERQNNMTGPNGLLLQMVRTELGKPPLSLTDDEINRRGYAIHTTIREDLQTQAVAAAEGFRAGTLDGQRGDVPFERTKFSISSVDPHTGAIVALYGGPNTTDDQINRATFDAVQGGSTFKPFTLLAALREGVSLDTRFSGASPMKLDGWDSDDKTVKNFGAGKGAQYGNIDLVEATAQSVNTVYAQLNLQIGPDKTAQAAKDAGITTPVSPEYASNVLGTDDVHPIDMAAAYATIADGGVRHAAHIVATVLNHDGTTAFQFDTTGAKAFEPDVVADATYAMQQVVQRGSGVDWVKPLGRPIAGKTGTTSGNKSAWFVGFTPDLVTAVSMSQVGENGSSQDSITTFGKGKNGKPVPEVTGATWPAFLWASYMKQAFTLAPYSTVVDFPPRADVGGKPTQAPTPTDTPTPEVTETAPVEEAPQTAVVPSGLENKLEADAAATLYGVGLVPTIVSEYSDSVPVGRVVRVDPNAGTELASGANVTVVISTGPKPAPTPTAPVPVPTPTPTPTASQPVAPPAKP